MSSMFKKLFRIEHLVLSWVHRLFIRREYWKQTFFLFEEEQELNLLASGKISAVVPGHLKNAAAEDDLEFCSNIAAFFALQGGRSRGLAACW